MQDVNRRCLSRSGHVRASHATSRFSSDAGVCRSIRGCRLHPKSRNGKMQLWRTNDFTHQLLSPEAIFHASNALTAQHAPLNWLGRGYPSLFPTPQYLWSRFIIHQARSGQGGRLTGIASTAAETGTDLQTCCTEGPHLAHQLCQQ